MIYSMSSLYPDKRPPLERRLFTSHVIDSHIKQVCAQLADPEIAWLFNNCYPNTLDTSVSFSDGNPPDSFVITGDIEAMWLRDSTAQIWPYLRYINQDENVKKLFQGLILRQMQCIELDPYANAFYQHDTLGCWKDDLTDMKPGTHERKWELDSLCYFLKLCNGYWGTTQDSSIFGQRWKSVLQVIISVVQAQKKGDGYTFQRQTTIGTETLALQGYGNPTRMCGLVRSAFRPSDDACILPFLIPSNAFFSVEIKKAADICQVVLQDRDLSQRCTSLSMEIQNAINENAIVTTKEGKSIYAYEVDGFGGQIIMDDANIPSLLALPYLGYCKLEDQTYQNTRAVLLSDRNPYYFSGNNAAGIGGPHIGLNYIWPMSIIMQAMTSNSEQEITRCLEMLKTSHAGTGFMHEAFHKDNPKKFTREWFGWVNSLFGELILKLLKERPHLVS